MAGRPKLSFTEDEIAKIEKCALAGCYTKTISRLTKIPEETIRRRFGDLISERRAQRKLNIRNFQNLLASRLNPAMLIFLGKNDLGQTDKREFGGEVSLTLADALAKLGDNGKKGRASGASE